MIPCCERQERRHCVVVVVVVVVVVEIQRHSLLPMTSQQKHHVHDFYQNRTLNVIVCNRNVMWCQKYGNAPKFKKNKSEVRGSR